MVWMILVIINTIRSAIHVWERKVTTIRICHVAKQGK